MRNFCVVMRFVMLVLALMFSGVQHVFASAKAGEAEVYEGKTATIYLADVYQRTLRCSKVLSYSWTSDNSSYVIVASSTQNYARIKGIKPTSSCKVYFKCSYVIDGFYRTMDFYYTVEVKSTSVSVTRVSLNRSSAQLTEGSTLQLTADVYPTNATNRNVNWSSSNTSVAYVDSRGLVTAKNAGSATITCRAADGSGCSDVCRLTVEPAVVYVSSISLDRTDLSLNAGETIQLNAAVYPSTATNKSLHWSSDNPSVAAVASDGTVTAKYSGTATVFCKAQDGSGEYATCRVSVDSYIEPEAIVLNANELTLYEGETFQLKVDISPEEATDKTLVWMIDDEKVVNVSADGTVTALSEGCARIFVKTVNELVASCAVTVKKRADVVFTDWSGHYIVASNHVIGNPTQGYSDDFEMTIENKNDSYFVTSMFGEDLTAYNDGGFLLHDNGDGTATIDISYCNILKSAGKDFPLYAIYVFDEDDNDWSDKWHFRMGDDGSIMIEDFYVASFAWNEESEKWENGMLETLYYNLSANKVSAGIHTIGEEPCCVRVEDISIIFDDVFSVCVFRADGALVYSGTTDCIADLDKGIYIVRYDDKCKKVIIR